MKRLITIALAVCILVAFLLVFLARGAIASPAIPELGDANADGSINMADVTTVERMILGMQPLKSYADANWDGVVNMADVGYIERIIVETAPIIHP
jgi:hypothetical protein